MTKTPVPDEVRRFILTSIPSVPHLEAVLLLRADGTRSWDAGEVARRLYIKVPQAAELLDALLATGIAGGAGDGMYVYAPSSDELRAAIDTLAVTYATNLVGVTDLIHSRTVKSALKFADAFRWTKEGK
ncbi:MAG: hypothetical protein ACXWC6_15290 [Ramlibacter sp.]